VLVFGAAVGLMLLSFHAGQQWNKVKAVSDGVPSPNDAPSRHSLDTDVARPQLVLPE